MKKLKPGNDFHTTKEDQEYVDRKFRIAPFNKAYKKSLRVKRGKGRCPFCGIDKKHHIEIIDDGVFVKCVVQAVGEAMGDYQTKVRVLPIRRRSRFDEAFPRIFHKK